MEREKFVKQLKMSIMRLVVRNLHVGVSCEEKGLGWTTCQTDNMWHADIEADWDELSKFVHWLF